MSNRQRYQQLLSEDGITQAHSAALICEQTQRPCSVRAVRSWLNDPEKLSSRECPDWAVVALEKALASRRHDTDQPGVTPAPVPAAGGDLTQGATHGTILAG
jgi:hypothetical protein